MFIIAIAVSATQSR